MVDATWAAGIRSFDVAPHYGLGLAERRLGQALASRPRDAYLVSTKVGRLLEPSPETADRLDDEFVVPADLKRVWDASEAGLRRSLAASSERTGIDRFDIAYLHDPEENVPPGSSLDAVLAEALPALARLRDEGVVRAIGVGSKSTDALLAAVRSDLLDVVMLAGRYTLLEQPAAADLLPACVAHGVQVVAVGVYNSGALSEDVPRPDLPYEYGPMPPSVFARVTRLAEVCRARHHPADRCAAVSAATPGGRRCRRRSRLGRADPAERRAARDPAAGSPVGRPRAGAAGVPRAGAARAADG